MTVKQFGEKVKRKLLSREFILYVVFGLLTTAWNLGVYKLLGLFMISETANLIAVISTKAISYIPNRIWVFESKTKGFREVAKEFGSYMLTRGATMLLDLGFMWLFLRVFHLPDTISKLGAIFIVVMVNYVLAKLFVFTGGRDFFKNIKVKIRDSGILRDRRLHFWSAAMGVFLAMVYVLGRMGFPENRWGATDSIFTTAGMTVILTVVFYALCFCLFVFLLKKEWKPHQYKQRRGRSLIFTGLFLLCWVPMLLGVFPGIIQYDTIRQLNEALGNTALSNHHPALHTLLIGWIFKFGSLIGGPNIGAFIYTCLQMLLMAWVFAYTVEWLRKREAPRWLVWLTVIYFGLHPLNMENAVLVLKDPQYSVYILLFTLNLAEIVETNGECLKSAKGMYKFIGLCLLLAFMRNNSIVILILVFWVIGFWLRRDWKKMLPVMAGTLVFILLVQGPGYRALGIEKTEAIESYSIPMLQIARVAALHEDSLSQEERQLIEAVLPIEDIKKNYTPYETVPLKTHKNFNEQPFVENKSAYLNLYLSLLQKHPGEYVKGYLCMTSGYWYPEAYSDTVFMTYTRNTIGITHAPIALEGSMLSLRKLYHKSLSKIPVLKYAGSLGFLFCFTVFTAVLLIIKKQRRWLLVLLPLFGLWASLMIASPLFGSFRYFYPFFTCLPIVGWLAIKKSTRA